VGTARLSKVLAAFAAASVVVGLLSVAPASAAPPSNDAFAGARNISGPNGSVTGTSVEATREAGEPTPGGATFSRSIWYRWVAPQDGIVSFDTIGSTTPGGAVLDTVLGIYTGNAVNALALVDDSDDISYEVRGLYTSRAFERVTAGTTYYVTPAGQDQTDQGTIRLSWRYISQPTNDDFDDARVINGDAAIVTSTNVGATNENFESELDGNYDASVWFRWTATYTGTARFDTLGSNFDTVLGAYTGPALNDLTLLTSNDDGPAGVASRIVLSVTQGTTYRLRVEGFDGENGAIRFSLNTPFSDVPYDHAFYEEIDGVFDRGIVGGYVDNTYRPDASVSRQAMAAFLYRLAHASFPEPATATFNDVGRSHPFFQEIEWLNAEDIADGYPGGLFKPSAPVSRQAMSAFLYRFRGEPLGPYPDPGFLDVQSSDDFYVAISWMADAGISEGYQPGPVFKPLAPVTRQAMAAFLIRYADLPS
jgi:hypothetical protein